MHVYASTIQACIVCVHTYLILTTVIIIGTIIHIRLLELIVGYSTTMSDHMSVHACIDAAIDIWLGVMGKTNLHVCVCVSY